MKKNLGVLGLALAVFSYAQAYAQQVGTIGLGDITFSADSSAKLRPAENVVSELYTGISSALVNTRKFTVLDYPQLKARLGKQGRRLGDYYSKKYSGNALEQSGLDYILKADVTEFGLFNQKRGQSENTVGLVDIDFELIGVADVTSDFSASVSGQFSTQINASDQGAAQGVLDKAISEAVDQLVDRLITSLFPIRIMKIDENSAITLNYGEGLLEAGDTILVYPLGVDTLVDSSGEPVGDAIATLQVTATKRKFALAQALEGFDAIKKGQKARLLLTDG